MPPYRADEEAVKENAEAEEGWDEAVLGDRGSKQVAAELLEPRTVFRW